MRARNLKPSFFTDDALVEQQPLVRLLFQGLWCLADCRGVLDDRPKQIKMRVLPADDIDVDAALTQLQGCRTSDGAPMVFRYRDAAGRALVLLTNFKRHQKPHPKEKPGNGLLPTIEQLAEAGFPPEKVADLVPVDNRQAVDIHGHPDKSTASPALPSSPSLPSESPFLPSSKEEEGAARLQHAPPPATCPAIAIPVREGEEPISQAEIDEWKRLYGNVDVPETLNHIRGHWLATDRSSRKTRRGIRVSIIRWLAKEHNRARAPTRPPAACVVSTRNAELARLKGMFNERYCALPGMPSSFWAEWIEEATADRHMRNQLLMKLKEWENAGGTGEGGLTP